MITDIELEEQNLILDVDLEVKSLELDVDIEVGTIIGDDFKERYKGPYIVIPKIEQTILETNDKVMEDDVTINSIPYQEVENIQGGETVIIAFE